MSQCLKSEASVIRWKLIVDASPFDARKGCRIFLKLPSLEMVVRAASTMDFSQICSWIPSSNHPSLVAPHLDKPSKLVLLFPEPFHDPVP